ncbi:guanine deaminase [Rhizoclosmatium globosum]|uniref:Guanine deaminase n=1 Tax=Rhizoclosmatium globosum TaxID=329046 RepID=A0A1Y2CPK5_9FUNG|nr:guanine deaminase [Rhizoclosmatium globosum]|eukprot:ORY48979.1 guanine deaminase [Rhizoclosmatium globosum]
MDSQSTLYIGTIIHSLALGKLEVLEKGAIVVGTNGVIEKVVEAAQVATLKKSSSINVVDLGHRLIIPGFVDGHVHAPQYSFVGTGMELPLLDWLNKYTFPSEAKFKDPVYARSQYRTAVARFLTNGTTTASYFATIHLESTKILADIVHEVGQRGIIGKVNMDRNSPDFLVETTSQSIKDTKEFVAHVLGKRDPLVQPVITPRFVPSTSSKLMTSLGEISASHDPKIRVQSHLSENKNEIKWVGEMHPECGSYADVYNQHGLLHERSYMAHCIWCSYGERELLRDKGVGIIHCPNSNFSLSSGALNVRRMLDEGLKVGLGSDVAGGFSPSMLDALRQSITASKMVSIGQGSDGDDLESPTAGIGSIKQYEALSYAEAFHLATVGGAECLSLGDTVGNFLPGKDFDALIIDPKVEGSPVDVFEGDSSLDIFQRFLFLGDDRNIEQVFVAGKNRKTQKLRDMLAASLK